MKALLMSALHLFQGYQVLLSGTVVTHSLKLSAIIFEFEEKI
jgi:hypothetical protein